MVKFLDWMPNKNPKSSNKCTTHKTNSFLIYYYHHNVNHTAYYMILLKIMNPTNIIILIKLLQFINIGRIKYELLKVSDFQLLLYGEYNDQIIFAFC